MDTIKGEGRKTQAVREHISDYRVLAWIVGSLVAGAAIAILYLDIRAPTTSVAPRFPAPPSTEGTKGRSTE